MAGADRIAVSGAELKTAVRDLNDASGVFAASAAPLRTAIPSGAFGVLGTPIAAAGNSVGGGFGTALEKLAKLATQTAAATRAVDTEFSRIEDDAAASFRAMERGGR